MKIGFFKACIIGLDVCRQLCNAVKDHKITIQEIMAIVLSVCDQLGIDVDCEGISLRTFMKRLDTWVEDVKESIG